MTIVTDVVKDQAIHHTILLYLDKFLNTTPGIIVAIVIVLAAIGVCIYQNSAKYAKTILENSALKLRETGMLDTSKVADMFVSAVMDIAIKKVKLLNETKNSIFLKAIIWGLEKGWLTSFATKCLQGQLDYLVDHITDKVDGLKKD